MTLLTLFAIFLIIYGYFKWINGYWDRKNLPHLPHHIPLGNVNNPLIRKENTGVTLQKIYNIMKKNNWKHGGLFFITTPVYFVLNLEYVKNITTKDFDHFADRGIYRNEKDDPFSGSIFSAGASKWKMLRTNLTPPFSSGKIKMMFQILNDCEEKLQERMSLESAKSEPIDVREIFACFSTDVLGSCVFGLDFKTLPNERMQFRYDVKNFFQSSLTRTFNTAFVTNFPNLARRLRMNIIPKDVADFCIRIVKDTVDYREKNDQKRNDFLQVLIDLKNNKRDDGSTLTIEEVAAQCFAFFSAGFETSSATATFALYELAKNQQLQDKAREEIETVLGKNGKITYETIQNLKYMNQVIDETLRKYPPISYLTRRCVKNYKIPDEDVVIEEGTLVVISPLGIHHDEEYYPDPEKFDPERFNEKNKKLRHHFSHIPFGAGPKICVAMRFGQIQNYRFTVNEKTKEPLIMQERRLSLSAKGGIWLDAHKL